MNELEHDNMEADNNTAKHSNSTKPKTPEEELDVMLDDLLKRKYKRRAP